MTGLQFLLEYPHLHAWDEPGEDRFAVNFHVVRVSLVLRAATYGDQHHFSGVDGPIAAHPGLDLMTARKVPMVQKHVAIAVVRHLAGKGESGIENIGMDYLHR